MDNILLEERFIAEEYREQVTTEAQQVAAAGGSSALTDVTSTTLSVTSPSPDTRNVEAPQAIGTGASPTFNALTLTSLTVGSGGTPVKKIASGTVSIDPPSIAAQTRGSVTFTLTGAAVGDVVVMQPPGALNAGLVFAGCEVTGASTVTVYIGNLTAGAIDDGANTWRFLWFDLT